MCDYGVFVLCNALGNILGLAEGIVYSVRLLDRMVMLEPVEWWMYANDSVCVERLVQLFSYLLRQDAVL